MTTKQPPKSPPAPIGGAPPSLPPSKPIDEGTTIRLGLALAIIGLLTVGAFTVGVLMGSSQSTSETGSDQLKGKLAASEKEVAKLTMQIEYSEARLKGLEGLFHHGLSLISHLDTTDDLAETLATSISHVRTASEIAFHLNARGYHIYKAEKRLADASKNVYRETELRRALNWFLMAQAKDKSAYWPAWNAACMFGLFGVADSAIANLRALRANVPPSKKDEFKRKLSTDTDFCPLDRNSGFIGYLNDEWGIERHAKCIDPPITVRYARSGNSIGVIEWPGN